MGRLLVTGLAAALTTGCAVPAPTSEARWFDFSGANRGSSQLTMNVAQCQLIANQAEAQARTIANTSGQKEVRYRFPTAGR